MDAMPTIMVTPVYGWGWIIAGEPRFEVPDAFTVRLENAEPKFWQGVVLDDGHEFQGRRVTLVQRHAEWDGSVNIEVGPSDQNGAVSAGFGMLARLPSSTES
jgi:hypothetical protein